MDRKKLTEIIDNFNYGFYLAVKSHEIMYQERDLTERGKQPLKEELFCFIRGNSDLAAETGFLIGTVKEIIKRPYETYKLLVRNLGD